MRRRCLKGHSGISKLADKLCLDLGQFLPCSSETRWLCVRTLSDTGLFWKKLAKCKSRLEESRWLGATLALRVL